MACKHGWTCLPLNTCSNCCCLTHTGCEMNHWQNDNTQNSSYVDTYWYSPYTSSIREVNDHISHDAARLRGSGLSEWIFMIKRRIKLGKTCSLSDYATPVVVCCWGGWGWGGWMVVVRLALVCVGGCCFIQQPFSANLWVQWLAEMIPGLEPSLYGLMKGILLVCCFKHILLACPQPLFKKAFGLWHVDWLLSLQKAFNGGK